MGVKQKILAGHTGEVVSITLYKEDSILISGSAKGEIFFWNNAGAIIRKLTSIIQSKSISSLQIMKRQSEFEQKGGLIKVAKNLQFTPFSKHISEKGGDKSIEGNAIKIQVPLIGKKGSDGEDDSNRITPKDFL